MTSVYKIEYTFDFSLVVNANSREQAYERLKKYILTSYKSNIEVPYYIKAERPLTKEELEMWEKGITDKDID